MHQVPRAILPPVEVSRFPPGTGFVIAFAAMIPVYALAALIL